MRLYFTSSSSDNWIGYLASRGQTVTVGTIERFGPNNATNFIHYMAIVGDQFTGKKHRTLGGAKLDIESKLLEIVKSGLTE